MVDRATYWICEMLGYALCELAFKTHCWGPFAWAYRAGCWFYGKSTDPGIRCGALIENPLFRPGGEGPHYIES